MQKRTTTIRIDHAVHKRALERVAQLGFRTFSEYIETLARIDAAQKFCITLRRDEHGAHWSAELGPGKTGPVQEQAEGALKGKQRCD